jgi:hypothetical protein
MPINFSGYNENFTAKGRCVRDGEFFTTDASNGHTVPTFPSSFSAFKGVPVRSGTGVWSVTLKDVYYKILNVEVRAYTTTANAIGVIMQPNTTDSAGRVVINWTFVTVGTTTAADIAASQVFNVFFDASEASIA